jgi:hypothetical protein
MGDRTTALPVVNLTSVTCLVACYKIDQIEVNDMG